MNRTHSSFNRKGSAKASRSRQQAVQARQAQAGQALAEGQHRPAPGLTPPSQENTWIDARVAAQQAREAEQNDTQE